MNSHTYAIVDSQIMPADATLSDFLINIASQLPSDLMIREGQKVTLMIEIYPKPVKVEPTNP